ncbi:DNA-processing protein DprA [Patescibacteria group bacterium]|nr:DNA-processing protein DprA [Patescibacteria group bacterium]
MVKTHLFLTCARLGLADLWRIKKYFGSFDEATRGKLGEFLQAGLDELKFEFLKQHIADFDAEIDLMNLENQGAELITIDDPLYPEILRNIYLAPVGFYARGDKTLLGQFERFFAVVGPRRPSRYGIAVAEIFSSCLAQNGMILVSGLAQGIDAIAHRQALISGVPTIAVLGSDIMNIFPRFHTELAANIIDKGGLIISESPPGKSIKKFNFAIRNRIISGLSRGVLVAEAGKRSGGLITARLGFEQNRNIYTVPNAIFEENSIGSNRLIASHVAKPVFTPYAILEELNISVVKKSRDERGHKKLNLDKNEELTLKKLRSNPKHLHLIQEETGLSLKNLLIVLSNLEIKGLAENIGQLSYVRVR